MVARPVVAGDPGAIEAEHHREAVQGDVVHDLIPGPRQERRVEGDDRAEPAHRHPGGAGDGVLLGDPDVEEAVGAVLLEREQTSRACHRGRDRDEPRFELGLLDDRFGERLRVPGRHGLRRTGDRVEHGRVVEVLLVVVLGRRVTAALLGEHVDDDRTFDGQLDGVAERLLELGDVVAVDGADVAHAERLEERRRLEELPHAGLQRVDGPFGRRADHRQVAEELLEAALAAHVHRVEADVGERARQSLADPTVEARVVLARVARLGVGGEVRHRRARSCGRCR